MAGPPGTPPSSAAPSSRSPVWLASPRAARLKRVVGWERGDGQILPESEELVTLLEATRPHSRGRDTRAWPSLPFRLSLSLCAGRRSPPPAPPSPARCRRMARRPRPAQRTVRRDSGGLGFSARGRLLFGGGCGSPPRQREAPLVYRPGILHVWILAAWIGRIANVIRYVLV